MMLSEDTLRAIHSTLRPKSKCVLLVALVNNEVVAGSLLYAAYGSMQWFRNASTPKFLSYQPNDALLWNSIVWGQSHNAKLFDLFGASSSKFKALSGIYDFKNKWGGVKVSTPVYLLGKTYSLASRMYYSSEAFHNLVVKSRRFTHLRR